MTAPHPSHGYYVLGWQYEPWLRAVAVQHALQLHVSMKTVGRNGNVLSIDSPEHLAALELATAGMGPMFAMMVQLAMCTDARKEAQL